MAMGAVWAGMSGTRGRRKGGKGVVGHMQKEREGACMEREGVGACLEKERSGK